MADLKPINIDLSGGVISDAEDTDKPIADMENLVKPAGGSPRGLRVRGGYRHFDTLPAMHASSEKLSVFIGKLDVADGYPAGAYALVLANTDTGIISEMWSGIETRGEPSAEETDSGFSDEVPFATSSCSATSGPDFNGMLMTWSPSAGTFKYYYLRDPFAGIDVNAGETSPDGSVFVYANYNDDPASVGGFNLRNMVSLNQAAMFGVTPPPADIDLLTATDPYYSRQLPGYICDDPYSAWVSRGGVHYVVGRALEAGETIPIHRTNVWTGANLGSVAAAVELGGSAIESGGVKKPSRPDADGYVVIPYQTRTGSTYKQYLAKIDPSDGTVEATLEITSLVADTDYNFNVIPLSSGGYFLHIIKSDNTTDWYHVTSTLSSATEILPARVAGLKTQPLVNLGGSGDTVYLIDRDTEKLLRLDAVSTTPALTVAAGTLPMSEGGGWYTWSPLTQPHWNHFRIDGSYMMWGMAKKVLLSTGAVEETYDVEDLYGLQNYDAGVPGGASPSPFTNLCPDPFHWLQNREGYRESV